MTYSEHSPESELGPWGNISKAVLYTGIAISTLPVVEHLALSASYAIDELSNDPLDSSMQLPHSSYDDFLQHAVTDARWFAVGAVVTTLGVGMGMVGTRLRARRDQAE